MVSIGREATASASSTLAVVTMLMGFEHGPQVLVLGITSLAMAASVVQDPPVQGRIKLTYPDFLRRWSGTSGGLTAHLAGPSHERGDRPGYDPAHPPRRPSSFRGGS